MKYILLIIFSLTSASAFSREGVTVRGGGDETALEFTNAFHAAVQEIEKRGGPLRAEIETSELAALLPKVSFFVEDRPILLATAGGTVEAVAVSAPASLTIKLNRARWRQVAHTRIREAIALHEILTLAGSEGPGRYQISAAYLAWFKVRNDAAVFLTGLDSSQPKWQGRRASCVRASGETFETAEASWNFLSRTFLLTYEFDAATGGAPAIRALRQTAQQDLGAAGSGRIGRSSSTTFSKEKGAFVKKSTPETIRYFETLADGSRAVYRWDGGQPGEVMESSFSEELPDGALRITTERLVCESREVATGAWIAFVGEPRLGIELEKLNAMAALVSEAESAALNCEGKGCEELLLSAKQAAEKFAAAWKKLPRPSKAP
ncbi:MAG: hypothetical protein EOP11_00115 [Proteobacteria bacterium]|nr:MAG: hypothetical protein EOP11_00115 [Pseudomonadota bacterium]